MATISRLAYLVGVIILTTLPATPPCFALSDEEINGVLRIMTETAGNLRASNYIELADEVSRIALIPRQNADVYYALKTGVGVEAELLDWIVFFNKTLQYQKNIESVGFGSREAFVQSCGLAETMISFIAGKAYDPVFSVLPIPIFSSVLTTVNPVSQLFNFELGAVREVGGDTLDLWTMTWHWMRNYGSPQIDRFESLNGLWVDECHYLGGLGNPWESQTRNTADLFMVDDVNRYKMKLRTTKPHISRTVIHDKVVDVYIPMAFYVSSFAKNFLGFPIADSATFLLTFSVYEKNSAQELSSFSPDAFQLKECFYYDAVGEDAFRVQIPAFIAKDVTLRVFVYAKLNSDDAEPWMSSVELQLPFEEDRTSPGLMLNVPDTHDGSNIHIQWSGSDRGSPASGLRWFNLWYRENNDPWKELLVRTLLTERIFTVQNPTSTYYFKLEAEDNAGNVAEPVTRGSGPIIAPVQNPVVPHGLNDGRVEPASATSAQVFRYRVDWKHPNGVAPKSVKLFTRGTVSSSFESYDMIIESGNPTVGATYAVDSFESCPDGWQNEFFFLFSDGSQELRAPPEGYYSGPTVACSPGVAVGWVWLSPEDEFVGGRQITARFEVRNNGATTVNGITLRFYVDSLEIDSKIIEDVFYPFTTVESDEYTFAWTPQIFDDARTYTVKFGVDPITDESDTDDNWYEQNITVSPPPGSISGFVLDFQGNSVKGAVIKILNGPEYGSTEAGIFSSVDIAESDNDGYYKIASLIPGTYEIEASAAGTKKRLGNVVVHANADTGGQSFQLTDGDQITTPSLNCEHHRNPSWSPDGTEIVYQTSRTLESSSSQIVIVNADGNGQSRIMTGPSKINGDRGASTGRDPEWSPCGTRIVFTGEHPQGNGSTYGIFIMSATGDGTDASLIVQGSTVFQGGEYPTWSADCMQIACLQESHIWFYDVDTHQGAQLGQAVGTHLDWSPNGAMIATSGTILNATTGEILHTFSGGWPSWLPDSSGVVYERAENVYVRLLADFETETPILAAEGVLEATPAISPSGALLCASSNKGLASCLDALFVYPFSVERFLISQFEIDQSYISPNWDGVADKATITYHLSEECDITMKLYASDGSQVREIYLGERQTAGVHQVVWDGTDSRGRRLRDGIYHLTFDAVDKDGNVSYPQFKRVNVAMNFRSLPQVGGMISHSGTRKALKRNKEIVLANLDNSDEVVVYSNLNIGNLVLDWSPDDSQLCFVDLNPPETEGYPEIFVVNTDGTSLTQLTFRSDDGAGFCENRSPSWSPDGCEIAYITRRRVGFGLYADNVARMNCDGNNKVVLTEYDTTDMLSHNGRAFPTWTGDGQQILISLPDFSLVDGAHDIWAMDRDGNDLHRLTHHPYTDHYPNNALDSGQIIWLSSRQTSATGYPDLWIQRLDGSAKWALWMGLTWENRAQVLKNGYSIHNGSGSFIDLFQSVTKGRLEGSVVEDVDGEQIGVSAAIVSASANGQITSNALTDMTGQFFLMNLEPGAYNLTVSRQGYAESTLTQVSGIEASATHAVAEPIVLTRLPAAIVTTPENTGRANLTAGLQCIPVTDNITEVSFEYRLPGETEWTLIGVDTIEPYGIDWDVSALNPQATRTYEIRALARDANTNLIDDAPVTTQITVDHSLPVANIVPLKTSALLPIRSLYFLQATSSDIDISYMLFQYKATLDSTWNNIGTTYGLGPSSIAFDTSVLTENSDYDFRVVAYDLAGNMDLSPGVAVLHTDKDEDSDGLPGSWEELYGLNDQNGETVFGPSGDPDRDGLSNYEELSRGTNPMSTDTDNDKMPDGWEVDHLLNPLVHDANADPDGDGATNIEEYKGGSDPNDPLSKPEPSDLSVSASCIVLWPDAPESVLEISSIGQGLLDWTIDEPDPVLFVETLSGAGDTPVSVAGVDFSENVETTLTVRNSADGVDVAFVSVHLRKRPPSPDVDENSAIDASDVQYVINCVLELESDIDCVVCDLDHDCSLTAVDVQLEINAVLGIPEPLK